MATKCEDCGRSNPLKYEKGPFIGSPQELDYCKYCSADLCGMCFTKSCPERHGADFGEPHEPETLDEDDPGAE